MTVIILGIAVIVVPYLGFPGSWRTLILVALGAAVAIIGFLLRGEALRRLPGQGGTAAHANFVERTPAQGVTEHPASHEHKEGITSFN